MNEKPELIVATNLAPFFHDRVRTAMARQRLEARAEAVLYVVDLLAEHVSSEALGGASETGGGLHTPLAELIVQARQASNEERVRRLRQVGDLALYVAGFFSDHLQRRLVDLDYYIGMGEGAYHGVATQLRGRADLGQVFRELAEKFARFVDVLAEVAVETRLGSNLDVLRLYERWQATGSAWAAAKLVERGLVPQPSPTDERDTIH